MKKIIFAFCVFQITISNVSAQPYVPNPSQIVIRSSATIPVIMVSSSAPTLVDTPQLEGSFIAEIQNRDASSSICCAFSSSFSTVTASAQSAGCRQIAANGGSWSVSRWWQNLRLYCQSLSTSASSPVAVTQGK